MPYYKNMKKWSSIYNHFLKRVLDFTLALLAFALCLPIFFCVFIFLAIANNGKPFFFQKRPGRRERIFSIIKFKTMNDKKDESGQLLSDGERLTAVGHFVRKTSFTFCTFVRACLIKSVVIYIII